MDLEQSRTCGAMWAKSLRLKLKVSYWKGKRVDFLLGKKTVEREEEKIKKPKLLFSIYGVPSVEIRQAKNESSSTRRGLRVGTENTGFHLGFKRGVREIKGFEFRKCPRDFLEFLLRSKR